MTGPASDWTFESTVAEAVAGDASPTRKRRHGGDYFALPLTLIEAAIDLGLDEALMMIVLARGTLADNRTTSWSILAAESRGILSRRAAKAALARLESAGLCSLPATNSRSRRTLAAFPVSDDPAVRDVAWIPNVFVDGLKVEGEVRPVPPLARLREAKSSDALRLMLHIYARCDLLAEGGVAPCDLRIDWVLTKLGDRGAHIIYGCRKGYFAASDELAALLSTGGKPDRDRLWAALRILRDLRLLAEPMYIFDGPPAEAMPLFPMVGVEEAEEAYAWAARKAASKLVTGALRGAGQKGDAFKGHNLIAAVLRHVREPHCATVFRPRYLADTEPHRRWLGQLDEKWRKRAEDPLAV